VTNWPESTLKVALMIALPPPTPPNADVVPDDAPLPPRALATMAQTPSGTVCEIAPAPVCEKLAVLAAVEGLAHAGADKKVDAVAPASMAEVRR
jgi:hypothetical protein